MSHIIQCRMQAAPEALERVLQVVRIRGFRVNGLAAERETAQLRIELRISGERSIDNLMRQLEKLVGMEAVHSLSGLEMRREAVAGAGGREAGLQNRLYRNRQGPSVHGD